MAAPDAETGDEAFFQTLTTKEGWRKFVEAAPAIPALHPDRGGLTEEELLTEDDARFDYLSSPITIDIPLLQRAAKNVRRLLILNRRQTSAKRGLILSGASGTGKSTTLTALGRLHELSLRASGLAGDGRIPVVYITLPAAATPRMIAVEFARFLGLPITQRANITDITESVCRVLCDTSCQLILVDELHNLSLTTRSGAEASDHLKYFSERLPATYVYAGIDLRTSGLFDTARGRQIAGRFVMLETDTFPYGTEAQRANWRALVASFEQALCLYNHTPGTLVRHSEYLYRRTNGMVGSLSQLIRGAAIDAIFDGTEKVTKTHLQNIDLDSAAEDSYIRWKQTRKPKRNAGKTP